MINKITLLLSRVCAALLIIVISDCQQPLERVSAANKWEGPADKDKSDFWNSAGAPCAPLINCGK